jgi:hypothetical protein
MNNNRTRPTEKIPENWSKIQEFEELIKKQTEEVSND